MHISIGAQSLIPSPLSQSGNHFEVYIYNKMIEKIPTIESSERRIGRRFLQICAILGGFGARLTNMNIPLKFAGENKFYGGLLVYGNTASWGSVVSWCLLNMINNLTATEPLEEERLRESKISNCTKLILKTSTLVIGMLAQSPYAYISYLYNNRNIFFPIVVILIDSAYPSYSLHLTIEKVLKKRNLSQFERKLSDIKQDLITCLEYNYSTLVGKDIEERRIYLEQLRKIIDQTDENGGALSTREKVKNYTAHLLTHSIIIESESSRIKAGRVFVRGCGWALAVTQIYFAGVLSYNATKEISDNPYARYATTTLITGCSAYLSWDVLAKSPIRAYDFVVGLFNGKNSKDLASVVQFKIKLCLQLLGLITISLSYAVPLQVCEDYFTGDFKTYMQINGVLEAIIIATVAISYLIDEGIVHSGLKSKEWDIKSLVELNFQLKKLISLIQDSPIIDFAKILEILPPDLTEAWLRRVEISSEALQDYINSNEPLIEI